MKTNKFLTLILTLVVSIAITSCVQDDDFSIPSDLGADENAALQEILAGIANGDIDEVSITELKAMYDSDPNMDGDNDDAIPFQVDTDIVVKGYVSSSDRTGNFYKEIYIQDNFENPTAAIKVIINQTDLYNKYNKGREVYIRLNPPTSTDFPSGLYIGEERTGNGVITIGGGTESNQFGTTVTSLGTAQTNSRMFRSTTTMDIVPLNLSFNQISDDNIGMFVQVDGVEFAPNLANENYFDPQEDFDTQRTMQACTGFSYSEFILETSSFSDFKNESLPTDNGSISGIIAKNYFGDRLLMALNSTDDVDFNNERCELLDINDFSVIFEEDFVGGQGNWEVTNTVGTRDWDTGNYQGDFYMRASAYQGNGNPFADMVSWLISPSIDFDAQSNELMILNIADAFSNGQPLKAYYSMDYTAGDNPSDVTWTEIGTAEIDGLPDNTGFFNNVFDETASIDLSEVVGNAVVALVYDSDNASVSTTIDIGRVRVLGL